MPDGDKFYRNLARTGKGWRTVYRLSSNKDYTNFPTDKVLEAIADNFRRISPDSLEKAITILHKVFEAEKWQKRGLPFSLGNNVLKLERALSLSNFQGEYKLAEVLKESVRKVFNENQNSCLSMSNEEITEKFGQKLAFQIMDSHFLSRVRDGIMEKQNRSFPEQVSWEQDLRKEIAEPAKKLLKGFVRGKQIRKPVTKRIDKDATSNILNRNLNIL